MLSAGAHAVVPRHVAPAELVQCIHTVARGSHYVSPTVLDWLIDDWQRKRRAAGEEATPTLPHFNARETRVISMALRGLTNRDIAANILTSERTVKNTLGPCCRRLGVINRKSLRRLCIDMRLPIIWTPAHRFVKNAVRCPKKHEGAPMLFLKLRDGHVSLTSPRARPECSGRLSAPSFRGSGASRPCQAGPSASSRRGAALPGSDGPFPQ